MCGRRRSGHLRLRLQPLLLRRLPRDRGLRPVRPHHGGRRVRRPERVPQPLVPGTALQLVRLPLPQSLGAGRRTGRADQPHPAARRLRRPSAAPPRPGRRGMVGRRQPLRRPRGPVRRQRLARRRLRARPGQLRAPSRADVRTAGHRAPAVVRGDGSDDRGRRRNHGHTSAPEPRPAATAAVRRGRGQPGQLPQGSRERSRRGDQPDGAERRATRGEHRALPAHPGRTRTGPGGGTRGRSGAHLPRRGRGARPSRGLPAVHRLPALVALPLRPGHQQPRLRCRPGQHPRGGRGVPARTGLRTVLRIPRPDRRRTHGRRDGAAPHRGGRRRDRLLRRLRGAAGPRAGGAARHRPGQTRGRT